MNSADPDSPVFKGIRSKLVRAEKHLDEVLTLCGKYATGYCQITPEVNVEQQLVVMRITLTPEVDPELSAVAGDFFFNMRSLLDHLVWQLVLANPPNTPTTSNQFPITTSDADFAEAIKRKQLRGVSVEATAIIETLQPHTTRNNPLAMLNKLHNIDKHRELNVVTVVADNADLIASTGSISMFLGNDELRHGAVWGNIGVPLSLPGIMQKIQSGRAMQMNGKCSLFVAFDDPSAEELEEFRVDRTLEEIYEFVRGTVLPALEPFLD